MAQRLRKLKLGIQLEAGDLLAYNYDVYEVESVFRKGKQITVKFTNGAKLENVPFKTQFDVFI